MELKEAHREVIRQLIENESWPAVLAYCEALVKKQAAAVLKCDVTKPRELLIKRANFDGAQTLLIALQSAKRDLKLKD